MAQNRLKWVNDWNRQTTENPSWIQLLILSIIFSLLIVLLGLLLWFLLIRLPSQSIPFIVTEDFKRRAELVNASRQTIFRFIQSIAGLGFIFTAVFAWLNYQVSEDKNISDRFSKAVEMLANQDLLEMRIGGAYLLERIAKDSKEDHPIVIEVLTAFIKRRNLFRKGPSDLLARNFNSLRIDKLKSDDNLKTETSFLDLDVQSAAKVIGRRKVRYDLRKPDFSFTNLSGFDFRNADLSGISFILADLSNADFSNANLSGANFNGADLSRATFFNAILDGASFHHTDVSKACLVKASLKNITSYQSDFSEAEFSLADLSYAEIMHSHFFFTRFTSANFYQSILFGCFFVGVNLTTTKNLLSEQLLQDNDDNLEFSPSYFCGVKFPSNITNILFDRDYSILSQILADNYKSSSEYVQLILDEAKNKDWFF